MATRSRLPWGPSREPNFKEWKITRRPKGFIRRKKQRAPNRYGRAVYYTTFYPSAPRVKPDLTYSSKSGRKRRRTKSAHRRRRTRRTRR